MEHTSSTAPRQHGPGEAPDAHGIDAPPENRPGVPMEAEPQPDEGAHWDKPAPQKSPTTHYHRKALEKLTPVHGTAEPPRGVSGLLRKAAYQVPEHKARHWQMLLAADRLDVVEDRLGEAMARRLDEAGLGQVSGPIKKNPIMALAGALAAGVMVRRLLD